MTVSGNKQFTEHIEWPASMWKFIQIKKSNENNNEILFALISANEKSYK